MSIANPKNKGGFNVYPNPARNEIMLSNIPASFEISIYTADGRQVKQEITSSRIDVSELPEQSQYRNQCPYAFKDHEGPVVDEQGSITCQSGAENVHQEEQFSFFGDQ